MRTDWGKSSRHARWDLAAGPGFSPREVPEVAAGYFWEAGNTTGFGTTGFRVLEGNGHSTFDLIQATVANQPTLLTENGGAQFRMRNLASGTPSSMQSGVVAAGWTGATYIGAWLRLPVDLTGTNNLWQHDSNSAFRISLLTINGTPDLLRINIITTAQVFTASTFATPFADLGWHWIEAIFDPLLVLGGSDNTDYVKVFSGLVALSKILGNAHPSALSSLAAAVRIANNTADVANNPDTTDWAAVYYANGIPSRANRVLLANRRNPSGVLLS